LEKILACLLSYSSKDISVRVDEKKLRKVDIPCLVGDNRKIKEAVAWEPRIPIEQTLKELLDDWRSLV
jgi:GDP-4-dehydro-6-deoxy-D-mannose reductase